MKMYKLFLMILTAMMSIGCTQQHADEQQALKAVEQAVEDFRSVLLQPDQDEFERLTSPNLTYGHSSGLVEDRATCIASMVTGKFQFKQIDLSEQTIDLEDQIAIVRHHFFASTADEGKAPGTIKLQVLQVWQFNGGQWRLLARQAVKI